MPSVSITVNGVRRKAEVGARTLLVQFLHGIAVDPDGLTSDIHASAEYRAHVIIVLAKRAIFSAQPQ